MRSDWRARARQRAGVTQIEAAVRVGASPLLVRTFERFGPEAVDDGVKRSALIALYDGFEHAPAPAAADGSRA